MPENLRTENTRGKRKNLFNVGALVRGMTTTFSYMFKKKPTVEYPSVRKQHAPRFHGLHELRRYADGKERCIGCELCAISCPANAITVIGAENSPEDRRSPGERYAARYEIDELRCIFCGLCEEACPTDAIVLTPRFEMADYRRGALVYAKDRLLVPPEAGVGTPPDERPNGIPADLGGVYREKDTVDITAGYEATHRGHVLKQNRKGLTLQREPADGRAPGTEG
jgi:NADH-quinone oxidoreductase subunit I